MKSRDNQEIEVRFLEINYSQLVEKLQKLGAEDLGEDLLEEVVFYDQELTWQKSGNQFVRIRSGKKGTTVTYKEFSGDKIDGATEIEFTTDSLENTQKFLEKVGLVAIRYQQKKIHTFVLDQVVIDIDTWPKIPTYVELEGESENQLRQIVQKLGLDWSQAVFEDARKIIENHYHIPVGYLKYFTFERVE